MEKLIIENIADFERVELELKNFNLLIGPQASGKSVIAKLLHFFKEVMITKLTLFFVVDRLDLNQFYKSLRSEFEKYFPSYLFQEAFKATYLIENFVFSIEKKDSMPVDFIYPSEVLDSINQPVMSQLSMMFLFFKAHNSILIPSNRVFFNFYDDNIYSMIELDLDNDPYLIRYGRVLEKAKKDFESFYFVEKAQELLQGEYHIDKKNMQEYLKAKDKLIKIRDISSGQQTLLQILQILNSKFAELKDDSKIDLCSFIIEEPEAHIFPETQHQLIKLFYKHFIDMNKTQSFTMTTHSPYILSSVNNLILSEKVKCKKEQKEYVNLDFTAYLVKDGQVKSIIDEDSGLIDGDAIDSASEQIGEEFDQMLEELYGED